MRIKNNYMPDVLDCLANLSSDEVFTPPLIANQMLDLLPQEVFESKETTFLDPFTKSGVFLREITKRLLEHQIPEYKITAKEIEEITKTAIQDAVKNGELDLNDKDYENKARKIGDKAIKNSANAEKYLNFEVDLQEALNHILTKQVFGIAITELTAQLSRRSLYCSKDASGRYSIVGTAFGINEAGNIRFIPMKHNWDKVNVDGTAKEGATCKDCGASAATLNRPDDLETHAYEFIHKDIEEIKKEYKNMEFTVICGNPPYQLNNGGGAGDSATPIYHRFIEQAKRLNPKYLTMIIPSKWMSGNILKTFREQMMEDKKIKYLYEFENGKECFPSSNTGSICYFLWDRYYNGNINFFFKPIDKVLTTRILNPDDIKNGKYIRNEVVESIINKINATNTFDTIVSTTKPYGIRGSLFNEPERYPTLKLHYEKNKDDIKIYGVKGIKGGAKRTDGYIVDDKAIINKNRENIDKYKIFFSTSYSVGAIDFPEPILANKNEICTETFLQIGGFNSEEEMENCLSYMNTRFFKVLLNESKLSVRVSRDTFALIPLEDFSKSWTDKELYEKYNLTQNEIDFIENNIEKVE